MPIFDRAERPPLHGQRAFVCDRPDRIFRQIRRTPSAQ